MGTKALVCIAVVVLAITGLSACGGGESGSPSSVSLETLVDSPEQWRGELLEVRGQLVRFTDPSGASYGVIEDAEQHRVGLKDIAPWQSLAGQSVLAEGTLEFDATFGWYLDGANVMAASQ